VPGEELVTLYFRGYAIDLARHRISLVPCRHLFSSPRILFADGWVVSFSEHEDVVAPSLAMLELPHVRESQAWLRKQAADLEERLDFVSDYDVYKRVYREAFDDIRLSELGLNELMETWMLLEIKRVAGIIGVDDRIRFARNAHFPFIVWGSGRCEYGITVTIHQGRRGLMVRFAVPASQPHTQVRIDEDEVQRIVASIRPHKSSTPGRDMRLSAEGLLSTSSSTDEAIMLARTLLALALQYPDDLTATRLSLASMANVRDDLACPDYLTRSVAGVCLVCGRSRMEHSKEFHAFLNPSPTSGKRRETP